MQHVQPSSVSTGGKGGFLDSRSFVAPARFLTRRLPSDKTPPYAADSSRALTEATRKVLRSLAGASFTSNALHPVLSCPAPASIRSTLARRRPIAPPIAPPNRVRQRQSQTHATPATHLAPWLLPRRNRSSAS
jgi:hypothetical protein